MTVLDNKAYPIRCDACTGYERHRWNCRRIADEDRLIALDEARFEGDIDDEDYFPARDDLRAKTAAR